MLNLSPATLNVAKPLKKFPIFLAVLFFSLLAVVSARAQGQSEMVQFTGVIVGGTESMPLPGVYVFITKASRGTVTNEYGYFSLSVLPGDSILFSSLGYKQKYHIIPQKTGKAYSVIVDLQEDITQLSPVTIYPYPTEEIFKESFLALKLPDEQDMQHMRKNLDNNQLNRMMFLSGMGANENYRNFTFGQVNNNANRNFLPTFSFLNPFAWAQFIKSVKKGDLKRKEYQK
ncbi:MAG: carboxypeptidase-like regulatory domain-containing protein [Bacteroidota bacterium]